MTIIESLCVIVAATIIGFIVGYFITLMSVSLYQVIAELPVDITIDWISLGALLLLAPVTVYVGTSYGMSEINKKRVTQILKGD